MAERTPDWSLLHSFLAVADRGSLSGAARSLGQSQPTLGRHIRLLEAQLGITLFRRTPRGLEPTEAALPLVEAARAMAQHAARLSRLAEGRQEGLAGTVRVTAPKVISHYLLPPILARLRLAEPEIRIELVPSDTSENLLFREADIALRMYRPEQLEVVARHVTDLPLGLFAAHSYVARRGLPATIAALRDHDFVGFDRDDRIVRMMAAQGLEVMRDFFALRCDDQSVYWELVRAGCGIGGMQLAVAQRDARVTRVLPSLDLPALPVWLVTPEPLRRNPRIRRVWEFLARALARPGAPPEP